jgi:hypothetical protein
MFTDGEKMSSNQYYLSSVTAQAEMKAEYTWLICCDTDTTRRIINS